ncbi:MAG: hypothetical protein QOJ56_2227 [Mycobacterium sp.]|nr:hypothetical protein [Mycobacterium sp.]
MVAHVLIPIAVQDRFPGVGGAFAERNRYVLQHARFYPPAERLKKFRKGRRKNCWGNAQLLAVDHPELTYVGCNRAGAKFFGGNRRSSATNGTQ